MYTRSSIKLLLCSIIILSPLCTRAETENRSKETIPSITVSPTISPIFTPNYTIENNPQIINYIYSMSYAVGMKIKDVTIVWMESLKKKVTKDNLELLQALIKKIMWHHRYKIAGGTVVGSYSATSLLLLADYHYLNCSTVWSRWKPECTFEDLCAIPQKDLARELLLTIGERYYNEKNPTDLGHPLIQFLNTIETEVKTIKRYIRTTKVIKNLHLITIFPTNENKINQAQKLLERALFIKHIFLSWLSEYNLASSGKN